MQKFILLMEEVEGRRIVTQHSYGDIFGQWGGALEAQVELKRVERKVIDTLYILQ